MDSATSFKLLTICVLIRRISTDLTVVVNPDQCGRSVELEPGSTVYLEYKGADLGDFLTPCILDFINKNDDDVICIKTDSSNYFNFDCMLLLKYYIGGYPTSSYNTKDYSCLDFSSRALCDRNTRTSVIYRSSFMQKNDTLKVWLYTEKYIPTTTRRWTQSPWSSWSSWSSDSNDYNDDDDKDSSKMKVVVGVTIGIVGTLVTFVICCVRSYGKQSSAPKPEYCPPNVQYCPQTQQVNQFGNQPQYPSAQQYPPTTGSQVQHQLTPAASQFPGYQIHAPVYQAVPNERHPVEIQPVQNQYPQPSAPVAPPPYPGY